MVGTAQSVGAVSKHGYLVLALAAAACGPAQPAARPAARAPCVAAAPVPAPRPTPKAVSGLVLSLVPKPGKAPGVLVSVSAPAVDRFVLSRASRADLRDVRARDDGGEIATRLSERGPSLAIELERPPRGRVRLEYTRAATPFSLDVADGLDPNHWVASGEALLALPESNADTPGPVELHIDAKPFGPEARAATSFGVGESESVEVSTDGLRRATFVAGGMGQAVLDGPEGLDHGVWLGYTSFDPRAAVAEVAGFRSALRQYFSDASVVPFTLLLVTDSRPAGDFDVARRTSSVLVRVGPSQTYNGPLRVAIGQQVLREWIGSTLFVGDPGDPGRSRWFAGGVARYVARELCFRFGLMTPAEYLAEVDELERIALASSEASRSNDELARQTSGAAVALQMARGAWHAADVDARLRAKSGGKRSLDHVLRELYARAKKSGRPLPESDWTAMLKSELGDDAVERFERSVMRGEPPPLPSDALGRCFAPIQKSWATFALGYVASKGENATVTRVDPGSPAARAGLEVGDRVVRETHREGDPTVRASVVVERAEKRVALQFLPEGRRVAGRGFHRLPNTKDEDCPRR